MRFQEQRLLGYFLRLASSRFLKASGEDAQGFLTICMERLQALRLLESRGVELQRINLMVPPDSGSEGGHQGPGTSSKGDSSYPIRQRWRECDLAFPRPVGTSSAGSQGSRVARLSQ